MSTTTIDIDEYSIYQKSLNKLNDLQMIATIKSSDKTELRRLRLTHTMNMCLKLGIATSDLKKMNIIHMTGTKGKGSTCAFLESMLRNSGYQTGLFSSPHLIEVRERIKVNGQPLSYKKFREYFEHCYDLILNKWTDKDQFEKPSYFQFLTCMMLYVFSKEGVDVAIIEVGIGGEYDFTNIVPNPVACGITSLGLDHCSILGYTYDEIAWQKSGIFKESCIAFTVDQTNKSTYEVMKNRANELKVPLVLSPTRKEFIDEDLQKFELGLHGEVQKLNASLALQIANYWIEKRKNADLDRFEWVKQNSQPEPKNGISLLKPVKINNQIRKGLENCVWLGRNQIIKSKNITYYLDGAHTVESIDQFIHWIHKINPNLNDETNMLLFNYTGERDAGTFEKLLEMKFDSVAFSKLEAYPSDFNQSSQDTLRKMPSAELDTNDKYQNLIKSFLNLQFKNTSRDPNNNDKKINHQVFTNVLDSLIWLTNGSDKNLIEKYQSTELSDLNLDKDRANIINKPVNVLITGSLYLVGLSLQVLDSISRNNQ